MDSVFCKWIRRGIISGVDCKEFRLTLGQLPIRMYPFGTLRDSSYNIAYRTGQSIYDCLYIALAVLLKGKMVTADRRLYDGLAKGPFKKYVLWVENIT
jgi:predicted nucleic acid-binding protein